MSNNILKGPDFKCANSANDLNQTINKYLLKRIDINDGRICMIDAVTKKSLKISEIMEQSRYLAIQLQLLGCEYDTVVGILLENRLEYITIFLGILFAGAIATFFNPLYTTVELKHTLGISRPSIVFCSSNNYQKVQEINDKIECIKHIILLDTEYRNPESKLIFSNLIHPSNKVLKTFEQQTSNDTALIFYSSGTTGLPKGVMWSHRNLIYFSKLANDEDVIGFYGKYTVGTLPMFHGFGMFLNISSILSDMTLIIMKKFDEKLFLTAIQEYKIKVLITVPPIIKFLLKDEIVQNFNVSSIEEIICGGAPLNSEIEDEIQRKFNLKYMRQTYGMTEICFTLIFKRNTYKKSGSCGSLIYGVQAKVVDTKTGRILPVKESGEICIKGPGVMKGYYNNIEETKNIFDKDGWLHTGDIGYFDEDGDFFIIDRLKDLIKYKGFQVAPAELEGLLLEHDCVYDVAVIGKSDIEAGEIPMAFVVKKPGSKVTETDLIKYINGLVSPQKKLRGGVKFIDKIPKNPSGKILKKKLHEFYINTNAKY